MYDSGIHAECNTCQNVIMSDCSFYDACKHLAESYGAESFVDCIASDNKLRILLSIGSFDYDEKRRCLFALHSAI